jgi:hypothetical protein
MQKIILIAAFTLLFSAVVSAQGNCGRHNEAAGGFSYCPPGGWVARDSPSEAPYKSFFAPNTSGLNANLNMKTEASAMNHDAYVAASVQYLMSGNEERGSEARKLIGWTKFATATNLSGSRMVYETSYKGAGIRVIQYIIDLPGKKLVFTGTSLVSSKNTTDKIFDEVAKSISLVAK